MPERITPADLDTARAHSAQVVTDIKAELGSEPPTVWVAVDDFGDGVPAGGPFNSYQECAEWIGYEEQLEPREMPTAEALAALVETQRLANERYQQWLVRQR